MAIFALPSLQGSEGVEQVLQILKDEFKLAMMLTGRQLTITLNLNPPKMDPLELIFQKYMDPLELIFQ